MAISAAMVKELREETGLPMMECKQALEEAGGEKAKAIEILRKKGLAQITKRAGRTTTEGRVVCHVDEANGRAAIAELLCETAPVADNEDFRRLADTIARVAARTGSELPDAILSQAADGGTVQDMLTDVVNRIRENIKVGRIGVCQGEVGYYLHHDNKKGVLVDFSTSCPPELKNDVCMHIVAMRPPYARRENVPVDLVEKEKALAREQVKGKPENIIDKIVAGKINKWFAEICLLEQPFVKDDKKTVAQVLREVSPDLTVNKVVRFEIGEG